MSNVIIVSDLDGMFKIKIDDPGSFKKEEIKKEIYDEGYLKRILERYDSLISLSKDERINTYFENLSKDIGVNLKKSEEIELNPEDNDLILCVKILNGNKEILNYYDLQICMVDLEQYY